MNYNTLFLALCLLGFALTPQVGLADDNAGIEAENDGKNDRKNDRKNNKKNNKKNNYLFEFNANTASLSGFSQIPAGGEPGSASAERPNFDEIGIEDETYFDIKLQKTWGTSGAYLKYRSFDTLGSGVLMSDLTTRSIVVPAGRTINVEYNFDALYVGYQREMFINDDQWRFVPLVEVINIMFLYRPTSEGIDLHNAQRKFNMINARLGIDIHYAASDKVQLTINARSTIPSMSNLQAYEIDGTVAYEVYNSGAQQIFAKLGIGFAKTKFRDNQEYPNKLELLLEPRLSLGLAFTF